MNRVDRVLVLGGGSAGFLAAITLKRKLPELAVVVLRSPEIGIIGVGEGTTPYTPDHLHGYLRLDIGEFYRLAQPSWKLGIRFLWGPRPFFNYTFTFQADSQFNNLTRPTGFYYAGEDFNYGDIATALMTEGKVFVRQEGNVPYIDRDTSYHLENETFVAYLEEVARRIGVVIQDDKVLEVKQDDRGIASLILESGSVVAADLFIDCSGFRSLLLGQTLQVPFLGFQSSLFNDRAVVGGWTREDEPILPYTTAETMNAGWCWQIEHERRINRGYVYSSAFISEEEAEREFREKCPKVDRTRVVRFHTGRYRQAWVKNVIAIGNSSGFVEPLESTSLGVICAECQAVAETLIDCERTPNASLAKQFNNRFARSWDTIRDFLAVHFKFNTRLATPYWKACQADCDLAGATDIVEYYRENGPSLIWRNTLLDPIDQFKIDGYLTLLLGQNAPTLRTIQISPEERQTWRRIQAAYQRKVENAFTVAEALPIVRSPHWQWNQDFYAGPRNSGG